MEQGGRLPASSGRVFMARAHPFRMQNEHFANHGQLPQFEPRTTWVKDWSVFPGKQVFPRESLRSSSQDARDAVASQAAAFYPLLQPMPAFDNPTRSYRGLEWAHHVGWVHNTLVNDIGLGPQPTPTLLEEEHLNHMLAMVSYGMGHSMTWLEFPFFITGFKSGNKPPAVYTQNWVPSFGMELAEASIGFQMDGGDGRGGITAARQRIAGRRWIVAPVNTSNSHWSMTIFDREHGHLYILDTLLHNRGYRTWATVQTWAQYWNALGMPYHFQYFVPETTSQEGGWECGYLGVYWVMRLLRDQTGRRMCPNEDDVQVSDLPIRDVDESYRPQESSLHLCDWLPAGSAKTLNGRSGAIQVLQTMLANEISLSFHSSMRDTWMTPPLDQTPVAGDERYVTAISRIIKFVTSRGGGQGTADDTCRLPPELFWTDLGGAQFALPATVVQIPAPRPETARAHLPTQDWQEWSCKPDEVNPPAPLVDWSGAWSFTPDNPVSRVPNHGGCSVVPISGVLDIDGNWTFDLSVRQVDMHAATAHIFLEIMHTGFGPLEQLGGKHVLSFQLSANFDDRTPTQQTTQFLLQLPDQYQPGG